MKATLSGAAIAAMIATWGGVSPAAAQTIDMRREYYQGSWHWNGAYRLRPGAANISRLQFNATGERAVYCYNTTCLNVKKTTTPDGGFMWSNTGKDRFKFDPVSSPAQLSGSFWYVSASAAAGSPDATVVMVRKR